MKISPEIETTLPPTLGEMTLNEALLRSHNAAVYWTRQSELARPRSPEFNRAFQAWDEWEKQFLLLVEQIR